MRFAKSLYLRMTAHSGMAAAICLCLLLLSACGASEEAVGGGQREPSPARILFFYTGQAAVPPGDPAQVCYGVENATSVRLEPALAEIRPLSNKCIWVEAKETMELTLIAVGEDGKEVSAPVMVTVKAGAPSAVREQPSQTESPSGLIETFAATATQVPAGGVSTICYVVSRPAALSIEPSQGDLGSDLKKCVIVRPAATTTYTLTASADGVTDKASVTVRVQ